MVYNGCGVALPRTSVSSVTIAVALLAIWGAVHGRSPFIAPESAHNVPSIQAFLRFFAAPFMILAVLVEEQEQIKQALANERARMSDAVDGDLTVYGRASTWRRSAMVLQGPTQLVLPWHFLSVNRSPAASDRAPTV